MVTQISGLYDLIGQRLGSLPEQLNTTRGDDTDSDSDDSATEESYASSNSEARKETVRDMLSVFDPKALPSEYGRDFADDGPATACGEELFAHRNLAATVYRLAIRDETFYRRLRRVVSRDICASSYFVKQGSRANDVMSKLDRYAEVGPPETPQSRNVDVRECARTLRLIVHQICVGRDSRASRESLGAAVISKVAEILVDVLYEVVCKRNRNIYENSTWTQGAEGHERDRNLYTYLIGNPPRLDLSAPPGMRDDFIIDRLGEFPVNEWSHLVDRLVTIADCIRENCANEPASVAYATKLRQIIRRYPEASFDPPSEVLLHRTPSASGEPEKKRGRIG